MQLTGYTDRWSVRPGESIAFHVHCSVGPYETRLVRLIHGDENPKGPGFKEIEISSALDGVHAEFPREIRKGSYGIVDFGSLPECFSFSVWVWPTLPGPGDQGVVSWLSPSGEIGFGLFLSAAGHLEFRQGNTVPLSSKRPLALREWYHATLAVDGKVGRLSLDVAPRRWSPDFSGSDIMETSGAIAAGRAGQMLFAAGWLEQTPDGPRAGGVFNGKIARPEMSVPNLACSTELVNKWNFGLKVGTRVLVDEIGGLHGLTINRPARTMTGPEWPGDALSSEPTSATHDAIHFHDDDIADVGWPESHRFTVPEDLPSGVYALRLRAGDAEDHLPFFVCPPRSGGSAKSLAVLLPTLSYLAYANESLDVSDTAQLSPRQDMSLRREAYDYVVENGLKSTYDMHRDGSGIAHGTRRRPIIDMRPKARCRTFDAPHQFAADLHLIDWLTTKGYHFDVITDDLLHTEGAALLRPYRVIISGSHPEYWTAKMLDARDAWFDEGGRFMYLGGNGFYWVTGVAEDEPDVIEVRRYGGTRTWAGEPGEEMLSVTGERGGLWRDRGRGPHKRVGVGFSGQGFDRGVPFRRSAASFDPEWAWIFHGVPDEIIGAGPSLVLGHGAAGFEVDKADPRNGTPPHAVVLASTDGFTDAYQGTIEAFGALHPWTGGSDPRSGVRADILMMCGPKGGAIFSVGSIIWSATLSASGYDSDTSRITQNVVDAFLGGDLPGTAMPWKPRSLEENDR
jgi:N,N-dimethylformamidase